MPQEVVMLVGCPASGKGTFVKENFPKYTVLNRDAEGGNVCDLIDPMIEAVEAGKSVLLDNTFPTADVRRPFILAATKRKVPVRCLVMGTTVEQAQVNALNRMWDRYGQIFMTAEDIRQHPQAKKDPNMFPIAALFKYRKFYEAPDRREGFCGKPEVVPFVRRPATGTNKALILDYDGVLRRSKGTKEYPRVPQDIEVLPNRTQRLKQYAKQGYILLGCSNQSGVAKKELTHADAEALFNHTNNMLGVHIEVKFCPHSPAPITCYCRKPQSGIAVHYIRGYDLNPAECIFVGDKTTDKSWAERVGFKYLTPEQFFGEASA